MRTWRFEDISTEDTIFNIYRWKNNRQFPIVLVACYRHNRNKGNQRIEIRKEVKKAKTKTSTTTYKKNNLFNNKIKKAIIGNVLLLISICDFLS